MISGEVLSPFCKWTPRFGNGERLVIRSSICTKEIELPKSPMTSGEVILCLYKEVLQNSPMINCVVFLSKTHSSSGYATHLVGKWHLGFYKWPYVPTKRGFDTAYGFWDGAEDHYGHTRDGVVDFRNGTKPVTDLGGKYATYEYVKVSNIFLKLFWWTNTWDLK